MDDPDHHGNIMAGRRRLLRLQLARLTSLDVWVLLVNVLWHRSEGFEGLYYLEVIVLSFILPVMEWIVC